MSRFRNTWRRIICVLTCPLFFLPLLLSPLTVPSAAVLRLPLRFAIAYLPLGLVPRNRYVDIPGQTHLSATHAAAPKSSGLRSDFPSGFLLRLKDTRRPGLASACNLTGDGNHHPCPAHRRNLRCIRGAGLRRRSRG